MPADNSIMCSVNCLKIKANTHTRTEANTRAVCRLIKYHTCSECEWPKWFIATAADEAAGVARATDAARVLLRNLIFFLTKFIN